jgi:hypothetical protein
MSGNIVREALIMVWRLWLQNKMRRKPACLPSDTQVAAPPAAPQKP